MALCPQCKTPTDADFGMVHCAHCGAMVFVGVDGESEKADAPLPDEDGVASHSHSNSDLLSLDSAEQLGSHLPTYEKGPGAEGFEDLGLLSGAHGEHGEHERRDPATPPPDLSDLSDPLISEPWPAPNANRDGTERAEGGQEPPPNGGYEQSPLGGAEVENFSDVVDYANDVASSGHQGSLYFRLRIAGIDTAEMRRELRETLDDSRFLMDVNQTMRSIHNGVLVIDRLNAVKASVLVQRLRGLSLDVTWEQYALHRV